MVGGRLGALGSGVALGLLFTCLQGFEYYVALFTIADSVYGSVNAHNKVE